MITPEKKIKCPLCEGEGRILVVRRRDIPETHRKAKAMRAQGFTLWKITRALGYKSPNSVTKLLKKP